MYERTVSLKKIMSKYTTIRLPTKLMRELIKSYNLQKAKKQYEQYWDKVSIKEDGCMIARTMEIECVRIGKINKQEDKINE